MVSQFTPSLQLEQPARGDYLNDWDLPANANYSAIDLGVGGFTTISGITGGTINLTQAQANSAMLSLTGSLTSNAIINYPTTSGGRKVLFPAVTLNGYALYVRGNGGLDTIGVYLPAEFAVPTPIIVTPSRVYWDYCGVVAGTIAAFPADFVPNGWLRCDGSQVSTTQFDILFQIIGYAYGGSGSSFKLPDYRGYALVGSDNMGSGSAGRFFNYGPGGGYGELTHTLLIGEAPVHSHAVNDPTHAHGLSQSAHSHSGVVVGFGVGGNFAAGSGWALTIGNTSAQNANVAVNAAATGISLFNAGSGGAHNNVQPSITVNVYIRW
jgi:microcystin-dependent protein